jgi:hypothetical protein
MYVKKLFILLIAIAGILTFSHTAQAAYRDTIQAESNLLYYWPMDATSGTTETALVGGVNLTVTVRKKEYNRAT